LVSRCNLQNDRPAIIKIRVYTLISFLSRFFPDQEYAIVPQIPNLQPHGFPIIYKGIETPPSYLLDGIFCEIKYNALSVQGWAKDCSYY